jgi:hypothetical protein
MKVNPTPGETRFGDRKTAADDEHFSESSRPVSEGAEFMPTPTWPPGVALQIRKTCGGNPSAL